MCITIIPHGPRRNKIFPFIAIDFLLGWALWQNCDFSGLLILHQWLTTNDWSKNASTLLINKRAAQTRAFKTQFKQQIKDEEEEDEEEEKERERERELER